MSSLTKKLSLTLFAAVAAVCLAIGLFAVPAKGASADTVVSGTAVLDDAKYFTIDASGVLSGLSADGLSEESNKRNVEITIPDSVTAIGDEAFSGIAAKITKLDLSGALELKTIGENAFSCGTARGTSLKSITIPTSVTSIGAGAFKNNCGLIEINFYAQNCADFADGANNPFFAAGISGSGVAVNIGKAGSIAVEKIPANMFYASADNKVTSVSFVNVDIAAGGFGSGAFRQCRSLETVNFTTDGTFDNVKIKEIGEYAFANCSSLANVNDTPSSGTLYIPTDTVSIGAYAFSNTSIQKIDLPNGLTTLGEAAFERSTLTAFTAPVNLSALGVRAFANCTSLATVSLNVNMLTTISESAFNNCSSLKNVTVSSSVKNIANSAFYNCSDLEAFDFGNLVTIGNSSFSGCSKLLSITIPASVTSIGTSAFSGCTAVREIHYLTSNRLSIGASPFQNCGAATVYIGNTEYLTLNKVKYIPGNLFNYTNISKVVFVNAEIKVVSDFGSSAFANCTKLTSVDFGGQEVRAIGTSAFYGCTQLNEVIFPDEYLNTISSSAFGGCSSLYSLTVTKNVSNISSDAFNGCNKLIEIYNKSTHYSNAEIRNIINTAKNVYDTENGEMTSTVNGFIVYNDAQNAYIVGYIGSASEINLSNAGISSATRYEIFADAFYGNTVIEKVTLSANLKKIGDRAFQNCTSLKEITIPGNVDEVGQAAFAGCTSLETATVTNSSSNISNISVSMFQGCTALETVNLSCSVSDIQAQAFKGCTNLKTIIFNKIQSGNSSGQYNLKRIYGNAFENCTSLEVIEIPETVTNIEQSAFAGCTSLKAVYLPSSAGYGDKAFDGCHSDLMLISGNRASYTANSANLGAYSAKHTYLIELQLNYDGKTETEYRLYNHSYTYEKNSNGTWSAEGGMPKQTGYSSSVWYKAYSSGVYSEEIKGDGLTALLATQIDNITLYAETIEKPSYLGHQLRDDNQEKTLEYKEGVTITDLNIGKEVLQELFTKNGKQITAGDLEIINRYYYMAVTRYANISGAVSTSDITVSDAGTYTIEFTLKEEYGAWASSHTIEFTISPRTEYIDGVISWKVKTGTAEGAELSPTEGSTNLYTYIGDGQVYLKSDVYGDKTPAATEVAKSYIIYTGAEVEIFLALTDNRFGEIVTDTYYGNTGKDSGMYNASVNIKTGNNYRFALQDSADLKLYGLTVTQQPNGTCTIYKTWYIVIANANRAIVSGTGADYSIGGWNYDYHSKGNQAKEDDAEIPLPGVAKGTDSLLSFALWFSSDLALYKMGDTSKQPITGMNHRPYTKDEFFLYVNKSMPAGNYVLILYIENIYAEDGVTVEYAGNGDSGQEFAFRVESAYLSSISGSADFDRALTGENIPLEYNGEAQLADLYSKIEDLNLGAFAIHPEPRGWWATPSCESYYEDFTITYNIVKVNGINSNPSGSDNNYYTEDEYKNGTMSTRPIEPGEYKVYYQITLPSYNPLVSNVNDVAEKERHYYNLIITTTFNTPSISAGTLVYDERSLKTEIGNYLSNDYYVIQWIDEESNPHPDLLRLTSGDYDDYTSAGTHYVFIRIKSDYQNFIVWADGVETQYVAQIRLTFAVVSFEIGKAQNSTGAIKLSLKSWVWGDYDDNPDDYLPMWSTVYGNDTRSFTYVLTSVEDSNAKYYLNGDGTPSELGLGFGKAEAGEYILTAYGAIGSDYAQATDSIPFSISKARIYWDESPYIESWRYGEFNAKTHTIPSFEEQIHTSFAVLGELVHTFYCYASDYEKLINGETVKTFDIKEEAAKDPNGQITAGSYILVYMLDATVNYDVWYYPVAFTVIRASNYWDKTPTINNWTYGTFTEELFNSIDYQPHFGDKEKVKLEYCEVDDNMVEISTYYEFNKDINLDCATYKFRATLSSADTANYTTLQFSMYFSVIKAQNSWDELPGIRGWSSGNYNPETNAFTGKAHLGTVTFIVTDENNKIYYDAANNINKLKKLGVGTYILKVHVEGDKNFDGLDEKIYFQVAEDSVGINGLIVATIVFAVIAVGLAAAAIVLLVRRNMKIEKEFRRAVRAELRRRKK